LKPSVLGWLKREINIDENVHEMYRALYDNSVRLRFLGKVTASDGSICRVEGYVFIYDQKADDFVEKQKARTTIIDLSDSGYVVNILDTTIELDHVIYKYVSVEGIIVTDNKAFSLNINEYS
jgi:hypothetical protein